MKESGRYWLRQSGWTALAAIPMAMLAAACLADVLELSRQGWTRFLLIVAVLIVAVFILSSQQQTGVA